MDNEERRQYNKEYYAKNKKEILTKLFTKEECELCGRMVSHQNIFKHRTSSYCLSRRTDDTIKLMGLKILELERKLATQ
jgi:hypothetical protein